MVKSRVNNLFLLEVSFVLGRMTVRVAQNSQNIENQSFIQLSETKYDVLFRH